MKAMKCKEVLPIMAAVMLTSMLTSCHNFDNISWCGGGGGNIDDIATKHEEKLRQHFIKKVGSEDVSALISETMHISQRLKSAGKQKEANKFDSYTDVLMFGNRTTRESLNDVMMLVKNKKGIGADGGHCKTLDDIFSFHWW
jgi:hypothetical protein